MKQHQEQGVIEFEMTTDDLHFAEQTAPQHVKTPTEIARLAQDYMAAEREEGRVISIAHAVAVVMARSL